MSKHKVRSERRKKILGVDVGTATHRLRKSIMFWLAGEADMNVCFRCGETIKTVDDFSIEHKDAWEAAADPVAAFFSLENIAFSHLICNIKAARKPGKIYESDGARSTAWWRRNRTARRDKDNARRRERRAAKK